MFKLKNFQSFKIFLCYESFYLENHEEFDRQNQL